MTIKSRILGAVAAGTLSCVAGCTSISDATVNKRAKVYSASFELSSDTAAALGFDTKGKALAADTAIALATSDSSNQPGVVLALLNVSDRACEEYMARTIVQSNAVSSALGVSSLALSTAAALSTPTRSANTLSGIAGFATGTEKQLSSTILGGKSPALLYKAVTAVRTKERSRILALYQAGGYHLAAAELMNYHALCGPTVGLNALDDAVNKAVTDAPKDGNDQGQLDGLAFQNAVTAFNANR